MNSNNGSGRGVICNIYRIKSISIYSIVLIIGGCLGSMITYSIYTNKHNKEFEIMESVIIKDQIKMLLELKNNKNDKVAQALEQLLNTEILTLTSNTSAARLLDSNAKDAIILVAEYRKKYPFITNSPGTDLMVNNSLMMIKDVPVK